MAFWSYWYFHIPNFLLAALLYTAVGRLLLGMFVPADWNNYIWRFFKLLTDPALKVISPLTPASVPTNVRLVFLILWLMILRVGFYIVLNRMGLAPGAGA
ncbi:MAG: hypothetical protein WAT78_13080 [Rhizobiaceae bacterium]